MVQRSQFYRKLGGNSYKQRKEMVQGNELKVLKVQKEIGRVQDEIKVNWESQLNHVGFCASQLGF